MDANGNLTARGTDGFTYDQANRLKTASVGGTSSTYLYDGDGKRASKIVGSTPTNYTYDVNASLPVLLDDGTRKYVWGLGLAFAVDTSGNALVYHTDGLGSVRALTDPSGTVVQSYTCDEYGNVLSSSGSITQPFQYTGEQRDAETGFVYLRARMYDPGSGRFLSRDYLHGRTENPLSQNRYSYGLNSPTSWIDPSGHMVWVPALVLIGSGVGALGNTINYAVNTKGNLSVGGAAEAFAKGGLAGGAATAMGVVAALGAAGVGVPALGAAAISGAASGFAGNLTTNVLYGRSPTENWLLATGAGAVLGPLAQDISPTVGFRTGYSLTRGLWSGRFRWLGFAAGRGGPNTEALYWQEAGFDAMSQFVGTFAATPVQASEFSAPINK